MILLIMLIHSMDRMTLLYPLVYQGQPLTKTDILQATIVYLDQCQNDDFEFCTWGDGDSLDRERVRDILLDKFNYDHKGVLGNVTSYTYRYL